MKSRLPIIDAEFEVVSAPEDDAPPKVPHTSPLSLGMFAFQAASGALFTWGAYAAAGEEAATYVFAAWVNWPFWLAIRRLTQLMSAPLMDQRHADKLAERLARKPNG